MLSRRDETLIGLGVMALAIFILAYMIPNWIVVPRNVRLIFLSPMFWPNILGWVLLVLGGLLTLRALLGTAPPEGQADSLAISRAEGLRLVVMTAMLVVIFFAIPVLGMVWTSMLAFVATVLLTGGKRMGLGVLVAVVLPLALYFFFSKVAGVSIPQGVFVRLP
jgi:hypothetical protein